MSSLCRHKLLKSIQAVHGAVISYANCVCEDISEKEKEIFFKFGLELAVQLQELRRLYISLYQFDPLSGIPTVDTQCCTSKINHPEQNKTDKV
ncbi:hypothetical protein [Paenibacillus sp. FSL K6-2441]|uniref:hypothetical protein n=1 Tax=Paenibacillus TaxID=44249 RepID=UPI0030DD7057